MHQKKSIFISLALCLLLVLSACSANVTAPTTAASSANPATAVSSSAPAATTASSAPVVSTEPPSASANPSGSLSGKAASFYEMFSDGNYHMKAIMTGDDGAETIMEVFARDGMYATILANDEGSTRMIIRNGEVIMILDEEETYVVFDSSTYGDAASNSGSELVESGMILSGSGTAEFAGKILDYEEYSAEEGSKTQFFFEGDSLAGIRNVGDEYAIDVIILELDSNIPEDVFEIPAGYEKMGP